ncbi:hypothetical protein GCM10025875_19790 [Litorihabitans aurantiacus]|uniref:Uncharacterized protein n=1 Tax=Litorihabitans aurantiacus TaxID=1930061 RepID=A0AA37XFD0_9MICO|nr:hypothetical protein GCM10025875_19790 [Litorihabitans aurantiacus]
MHERGGEPDLLGHARRVVRDELARVVGETEDAQEVVGALRDDGGVHPPQEAGVGHELGAGEAVEEAEAVGQDAEPALGRVGVLPDVDAVDVGRPGVGREESGGHAERGGLARAVGPDDAVVGARRDGQLELLHGDLGTETFEQAPRPQGRDGRADGGTGRRGRGGGDVHVSTLADGRPPRPSRVPRRRRGDGP